MKKTWFLFSLFNFFIAAIMGFLLRTAFVWEIDWLEYRNMMHGHSHVAMLGWIYLALYALIWYKFIPRVKRKKQVYALLFWFTQFTVIGMMISFPIQGYGAVSISFSSFHIIASYVFSYRVWRDHQAQTPEVSLLLKTALLLMVCSTIGVWILGPLVMSGARNSTLYQVAIQFYLHFQFHGWFTFAVLALFIDAMAKGYSPNKMDFKWFYGLLILSTFLTYGLVINWGYGGDISLITNGIGLVFQLLALILFFKLYGETLQEKLSDATQMVKVLVGFGLSSWVVKMLLQTAVVVPEVALVSFTLRPLMIGFIHLTMLGFVTGLLLVLFYDSSAMLKNSRVNSGIITFLLGVVLTEMVLFIQGLFYWMQWGQILFYYEILFGASVLLPFGIFIMLFGQLCPFKYKYIKFGFIYYLVICYISNPQTNLSIYIRDL